MLHRSVFTVALFVQRSYPAFVSFKVLHHFCRLQSASCLNLAPLVMSQQRSITSFFTKAQGAAVPTQPLRTLTSTKKVYEQPAKESKNPEQMAKKTESSTDAQLKENEDKGSASPVKAGCKKRTIESPVPKTDSSCSDDNSQSSESSSESPKQPITKKRRRMISSSSESSMSDSFGNEIQVCKKASKKEQDQETKKEQDQKTKKEKDQKTKKKQDQKTKKEQDQKTKKEQETKTKKEQDKKEENVVQDIKSTSSLAQKEKAQGKQKNKVDGEGLNSSKAANETATKREIPAPESMETEDDNQEESSKQQPAPESYNPGKVRYNPIADAAWSKSDAVPYLALAKTFEAIEATPGRLRTLELLCNFLRSVRLLSPGDLLPCVYLCLNQLAPAYEAVELGVGDSVLMKAMALSTGSTVEKIKQKAQVVGDLGVVSESLRSRQAVMCKPKPLTVAAVFQRLKEVADMSGNSAQQRKVSKIQALLVSCRQCEAKYLIRSLSGRLRIGLAELSVLSALGHAFVRSPSFETPDAARGVSPEAWKRRQDEAALQVRTAYCRCPNYAVLIEALLSDCGLSDLLSSCQLRVGVPLKPMLAHPTKGVGEVLKRFDGVAFTCEFKYDGERAQIHRLKDGTVRVYSRNQEDNTTKYPDIAASVPELLKGRPDADFILDSEAVAYDPEKGQILPFQVLTTRKRKDADADSIKVQVCVFAFDILYYNGESLVERPLRERRQVLHDGFNFADCQGRFALARWQDCTDTEEIQGFLDDAIKGNCEGLMLKALDVDATYEIAKRSHSWLKLKKDYVDGVGDTLDLVVIGGYHGTGKRAGKLGGFLLACYHPDDEEFQTVCKIGTGFSDEDLDAFTRDLAAHKVAAPRPYVRCGPQTDADVWFDPAVVWEVKAADFSLSPAYVAAIGLADPRRGISLRFPRFVRRREDKKPEEATTASQLAEMYKSQEVVKSAAASSGGAADEEEDYY